MGRDVRRRFWLEIGLAAVAAVLAVVTLISREWIELVFGFEPDNGDGSFEWALVAVLAIAAAVSAVAARREWRRPLPAAVGT